MEAGKFQIHPEPFDLHQEIIGTVQMLTDRAKQKGLELTCKVAPEVPADVNGDAGRLPVSESALPRPVSPYGVTKLAAEHLVRLYARDHGLPALALRYFTVYGPRQRPDMAFSRFLRATLEGEPVEVNGDGEQTRDFTFVDDVVEANLAAASVADTRPGAVYNLGGGTRITINGVLRLVAQLTGRTAVVQRRAAQPGDARHTFADCAAARRELGFEPAVDLEQGLRAQLNWLQGVGEWAAR